MDRPQENPIPLDYSSPGEERRREEQIEGERKEALGNYNEAMFGERRPYLYFTWRLMVSC